MTGDIDPYERARMQRRTERLMLWGLVLVLVMIMGLLWVIVRMAQT